MQHHFQIKSVFIFLAACFFLQSCSTSYQASRFSHLKYVKKDAPEKTDDAHSLNKSDLEKINSNTTTALKSQDEDDAFLKKGQVPESGDKSAISHSAKKSKAANEELLTEQKHVFANGIGQVSAAVKDKFSEIKALSPMPITEDQDKLLLLWLILAGAAIVFGLLSPYSVAFGILATLAAIAAVVFFILWIVNIAKS